MGNYGANLRLSVYQSTNEKQNNAILKLIDNVTEMNSRVMELLEKNTTSQPSSTAFPLLQSEAPAYQLSLRCQNRCSSSWSLNAAFLHRPWHVPAQSAVWPGHALSRCPYQCLCVQPY